jgi:hypothetical protein
MVNEMDVEAADDTDTQAVDPDLLRVARAQRADLRKAMLDLEHALARPAPGRVLEWSDRVHDALVDVAATFERHIAVTEGETGFLAEIAEHSPRLINAIQRMCEEHERIRGELASTLDDVRRVTETEGDVKVAAVREHVTGLVTDLVRHRQHGADLVYEAHAVDIGGSD